MLHTHTHRHTHTAGEMIWRKKRMTLMSPRKFLKLSSLRSNLTISWPCFTWNSLEEEPVITTNLAGTWKRRPVFISQERVKVFVGASFTQTSGTPCFIKMKPFFEIINSSMMVPVVSQNLNLKPKKHTWQNAYLAWKEPNDDDRWGERSPGTRECFEAIYRNMIDASKLNRLL